MIEPLRIRDRIGLSTGALKDRELLDAVEAIRESGLRTIEIAPHLYGGPGDFNADIRSELKRRVAGFAIVTVHPSAAMYLDGQRINYWTAEGIRDDITSLDSALRRQSVEDMLGWIDVAAEIGAEVITFHPGLGDRNATEQQKHEAYFDFARAACARADGSGLWMGFEVTPVWFDLDLIAQIDRPEFGLLFDIGHVARGCEGDMTGGVVDMIEQSRGLVMQFHAHGVRVGDDGKVVDHVPLQSNELLDYGRVMPAIRDSGFAGPIILEITRYPNPTSATNLANAHYALDHLATAWDG